MVEELEFVKSCFDYEAVVVQEIGGWKAGWEENARRIVQTSHEEKRDGVVRLSCYCNAALGSANRRVLDSFHGVGWPRREGVKGPMRGKSAALP